MRAVALSLFLVGCGFNSSNGGGDGGPSSTDLAGATVGDAAVPSDGPVTPGADLSQGGCTGCGCGAPALLVAIQSVNGATGSDGRVLQLSLGTGGAPTSCGMDLTANKSLPKSPLALGWAPPNFVIYAAQEGVVLIDSTKDLQHWVYKDSRGSNPLSVFSLQGSTGQPVIAVGYDTTGFSSISQLTILDIKNASKLFEWQVTNATSPIVLDSEVPAMAPSPLDPTHVFYVDNGSTNIPAADIALPYDGKAVKATPYWSNRPTGTSLTRISTVKKAVGNLRRTVWLQTRAVSAADGVYYTNDDGTGPAGMIGPLSCNNPACATPFSATDAVADPTSSNRVIATCKAASGSNVSHVVRIDDSGACTVLVDGTSLATSTYPQVLAIIEAQ